jgi:hypothetical protein
MYPVYKLFIGYSYKKYLFLLCALHFYPLTPVFYKKQSS